MEEKPLKQRLNEAKFPDWIDLPNGGRRYWYEVKGKLGFKAMYVKEVNGQERTIRFYQEIYDGNGNLVEIHEKFPEERGHRKIRRG